MSVYFAGYRPEYPDGVTARDIDGPDDENLYCKCGGDLSSSLVGDEFVLHCRSCGMLWPNAEDWMRLDAKGREFSPEQQAIIDRAQAAAEEEAGQ